MKANEKTDKLSTKPYVAYDLLLNISVTGRLEGSRDSTVATRARVQARVLGVVE